METELMKLLKLIELFNGLTDAQIAQIAQIAQQERYNQGQTILSIDNPGDKMYLLAQGQVEIHLAGSKTTRPALYLGEGQIFGEIALLDSGTRSATVVAAHDDTLTYTINRQDFMRLCEQDTALGFLVMRNLALDLAFKLRHRNYQQI